MKTNFQKIQKNIGKWSHIFLGAFFLGLVLLNPDGVVKALASDSITVSGDFTEINQPELCDVPDFNGANLFVQQKTKFSFSGGLVGTLVSLESIKVHPNGTVNLHAHGTFCGTVYDNNNNCRGRGTFAMDTNLFVDLSSGTASGRFVGHNGTEGMSNLHLVGSISLVLGVSNTYEAKVHFDPQVDAGCDTPVPDCTIECK